MTEVESRSNRQTLIFLHLPKTGGMTLRRIINRQYDKATILTFAGPHLQESVEEFKRLSERQKQKIRVLSGHIDFGLHEFLPQPSTYLTILRDPIELVISYYYFLRRLNPNHFFRGVREAQRMSLADFVSGKSFLLDNFQTRRLAAADRVATPFGQCSTEIVEIAKKNLREHFGVVGLTERFDETLMLLMRTFGWKTPFYAKANVTPRRPRKEALPKETLDLIAKFNEQDIELYRYAEKRFDELVCQQDSFERALKTFQLLNVPGGFYHVFRSAIGQIKPLARIYYSMTDQLRK